MFGDLSGMMKKLEEAQQRVAETKKRLDTVLVDEVVDGKLSVTLTANREVKSIEVDPALLSDKEELEDYLIIALNKALQKAGDIHEKEMAIAAKTGMPNIPGMDFFK